MRGEKNSRPHVGVYYEVEYWRRRSEINPSTGRQYNICGPSTERFTSLKKAIKRSSSYFNSITDDPEGYWDFVKFEIYRWERGNLMSVKIPHPVLKRIKSYNKAGKLIDDATIGSEKYKKYYKKHEILMTDNASPIHPR